MQNLRCYNASVGTASDNSKTSTAMQPGVCVGLFALGDDMVEADAHPLTELIEDVALWPFRLAHWAAKSLKAKATANAAAPMWVPKTEVERAVLAALILAGEPVNNLTLAALMGVSPGEASRRVSQLHRFVSKTRKGRQVLIGLN
jgi:hypothetical protein